MLIIRNAQMCVFRSHAEARFEDRAVEIIRGCWAAEVRAYSNESAFRMWVRGTIATARSHRLYGDRALIRFLNLLFVLDHYYPDHNYHEWIGAVLSKRSMDPNSTMDELMIEFGRRYR